MTARAHPSAVIEAGARLGSNVVVGPFCHIGPGRDEYHDRPSAGAHWWPGTRGILAGQDLKAGGKGGRLVVGSDCVIREGVTINAGGGGEGDETRVGDRCVLLAYCHVAHDCRLGESVILSNNVLLGGHVRIGDHAMIGGASAVHQYARIGAHAFVPMDDENCWTWSGFSSERIARLRAAYRLLFAREALSEPSPLAVRAEALSKLDEGDADIALMVEFLRAPSSRPVCAPRAGRAT